MKITRARYLPYFVALMGVILSLLLYYTRYVRNPQYDQAIDLGLNLSISLLIAALVAMMQKVRQHAVSMQKINATLKAEIQERIKTEKSKKKLENALLQGQKLQAIGTLAGGIAHDFNNILYAIIGYTQLAQADVDKDSLTHKNLDKVLEGTHRGQELISRILAFSRRQHHEYVALNLNTAIESALSLLNPTIPASVIINFTHDDNPTIIGNQNQLHQVIVNIVNNAVDAMDSEGTINIHVSRIESNNPLLTDLAENPKQPYCKINISDTGHGMDESMLERIFEPFYTTKEVGKGTGLGLSIVHSIIKEHAGRISVNSELGKGSIFTIILPEQLKE